MFLLSKKINLLNKRREKLSSKVLSVIDNARLYMASLNQDALNAFKWKVFPNPAYSLDLAKRNLQLFSKIKDSDPLV